MPGMSDETRRMLAPWTVDEGEASFVVDQSPAGTVGKSTPVSSDSAFEPAIPLPDGRELRTFRHAAEYVQELTAAAQKRPEWQTAVSILIAAAEGRDFPMHARIAMVRAVGRS
jgi:hypothetical protein